MDITILVAKIISAKAELEYNEVFNSSEHVIRAIEDLEEILKIIASEI